MTSGVCVIDELVVDTSALISWPITELAGAVIVKSQIQELERLSPSRADMIDAIGVIVSGPSQDAISSTSMFAMETGDMGGLSVTDLHLVATAYEREGVLVTDDYRMQNVAERMGIRWESVNSDGISQFWTWKLKCLGCGKEYDSPETPAKKRGLLGECIDCGSKLKLKRI